MRKLLTALVLTLLVTLGLAACGQDAADKKDVAVQLNTEDDKISYAIGVFMGTQHKDLPLNLNVDALAMGIRDSLAGNAKMTDEEVEQQLTVFNAQVNEFMTQQAQEEAAQAKADNDQFLQENAAKEGWQTTESGLQYKIVEPGTDPKPADGDTVVVHYTGSLLDGTVFDSSRERGEPASFPLNGSVIEGFAEAVKLVGEGGTIEVVIPSDLAYGEQGAGQMIPPSAILRFDIEVVEVQQAEAAAE